MTLLTRSPEEWEALETLAAHPTDADGLRRAQAWLWLDEGERVAAVAAGLRVTRQAVYKWVAHFRMRDPLAIGARLAPGKRRGRPRTVPGGSDPRLLAGIDRDPRELGYRSTIGTAPRLGHELRAVHPLAVSRPRVSFAMARLGRRWKRPRDALARRPPTWRQAQGGSSLAWPRGRARSS
jgi:transposase